jgi:hypothetical protein
VEKKPRRTNSADYSKKSQINNDRLDYLYRSGFERAKKYEQLTKEKQEQDKIKEIEHCTFKPKIHSTHKRQSSSIYERQKYWKCQIDEK